MSPAPDLPSADDFLRKAPVQKRSRATIAFIAEAAHQVLRDAGEAAVTTTAVADRAGVSIGTVYQYFADRDALLRAAGEHEREAHLVRLRRFLAHPGEGEDRIRSFIRHLIRSMMDRHGARRQFTLMAVAALEPGGGWRREQFADVVATHWGRRHPGSSERANRMDAIVLTNAMVGALQGAAMGDRAVLDDPAFEDALCRLARSFWSIERRRSNGLEPVSNGTGGSRPQSLHST